MTPTILKQWVYVTWYLPGSITINAWSALDDATRDVIITQVDVMLKIGPRHPVPLPPVAPLDPA